MANHQHWPKRYPCFWWIVSTNWWERSSWEWVSISIHQLVLVVLIHHFGWINLHSKILKNVVVCSYSCFSPWKLGNHDPELSINDSLNQLFSLTFGYPQDHRLGSGGFWGSWPLTELTHLQLCGVAVRTHGTNCSCCGWTSAWKSVNFVEPETLEPCWSYSFVLISVIWGGYNSFGYSIASI